MDWFQRQGCLMDAHYVNAIRNDVYTRDSLLTWHALLTDSELPVEPQNVPSTLARGFLVTMGVNTRPRTLREPFKLPTCYTRAPT
jgi:hypothetical protein